MSTTPLRLIRRKQASRPFEVRYSSRPRETGVGRVKKFADNAGAVALTLGLILSALSLYDVLVRKPDADRLLAITQFNQTVNSAAKIRQELIQSNSGDAATRLAVASMATPRILNDIATARALLPTLAEEDVGIPQLLILVNESMTAGDMESAAAFVERAVQRRNKTPLMTAESLRYKGRYLYALGSAELGRAAYLAGLDQIPDAPPARAARAFHMADLIAAQLAYGSCEFIERDLGDFTGLISAQGVATEIAIQLASSVNLQIEQFGGKKCPRPKKVAIGASVGGG